VRSFPAAPEPEILVGWIVVQPGTGFGEINGDLLEADFWPVWQKEHPDAEPAQLAE
jgi:hypothetical protein